MISKIKCWMAIASFVCAIGFGISAMCIPPEGVIDDSILWYTGQLFLFITSLLGIKGIDFIGKDKKN